MDSDLNRVPATKLEPSSAEVPQRTDELYRLLVESVQDYAIFVLNPEGYIISWNPGAERIKGYAANEIIGKHFRTFYTPEAQADRHPEYELEVAAREGRYAEEGWRVRKDGSQFWASVTITALRTQQGRLVGFAKVTRDLTERKLAEEDRIQRYEAEKRLREELDGQATRLEELVVERTRALEDANMELEAFAYSVAHDLRAPVRAMQGFSEILLEEYGAELDETGRDYLQRIAGAADQMEGLIRDLLAFSRLGREEIRLSPVPLDLVWARTREELASEIREQRAEVAVESPLPMVRGHETTLIQVMKNLVGNAIKFVAPGARPQVRIRAEEREGRARVWVEDNGIGIAPEHRERIFRIFERLHGIEQYPGTGIGLALVRKGVERLGGRVGVESVPGQGSRFWFELPVEVSGG
ncbi:MAG TPA: ATP-binding protein [Longimicrobiaceae bacterium]|nr:ATP-binding protein [Longimicrobiaceae bacterium]